MADRERQATYDAEAAAYGAGWLDAVIGVDIALQATAAVVADAWWSDHVGVVVDARAARADAGRSSCRRTGPSSAQLRFAPTCRWSSVAHELAHAAAPAGSGHDRWFRGWHVGLVTVLFDQDSGERLGRCYRDAGLDVAPIAAAGRAGPGIVAAVAAGRLRATLSPDRPSSLGPIAL